MQLPILRAAFLALVLPSIASADSKRPITLEDLWAVKRVGPPSMAPDGKWCVVEVTTYRTTRTKHVRPVAARHRRPDAEATDEFRRQELRADVVAGRARRSPSPPSATRTRCRKSTSSPRRRRSAASVAPADRGRRTQMGADSKSMLFVGWTWPDAAATKLTRPGKETQERQESGHGHRRRPVPLLGPVDHRRQTAVRLASRPGERQAPLPARHTGRSLPPYEPSDRDYDVSPDGKEICFVTDNVKEIGLDANTIYSASNHDMTTPSPKNITADNPANDTRPVYSPDGKYIAFLRQRIKHFYADRTSLMLLRSRSGTIRKT